MHPDGSIWFTDPTYGIRGNYEGFKADSELPVAVYRVDPKTAQVKPLLATAWKWVNPTTLEMDLRKDVVFHSGAPMDADDVVYTLNFVSNKENAISNYALLAWIKSAEKIDKHKVRINLKSPFPPALAYLAGIGFIMQKGHYDKAPARPDGKKDFGAVPPNGTGPYKITEVKPGQHILMERNPAYFKGGFKGTPTISKIMFRTIKDANTRAAELMTGAAELARREGVRLHTHLAETLDEEEHCLEQFGCTPVDYMERLGWLGPDVWFAHAVHLHDKDIARFAEHGTGTAHCPSSNGRLGAGIARVSCNDLRRTFATWLAEAGVPEAVTASLLGHASSQMVRRVYTRIGREAQRRAVAMLPRLTKVTVAAGVANEAKTGGLGGQDGQPDSELNPEDPVPRAGIEPATRGFSVPCSTN